MSSRYASLFAALQGIPDLSRGLCVGDDPQLWDLTSGLAVQRNLLLCSQCVERPACAAWAARQPRGSLLGVVGGKVSGGEASTGRASA